MIVKLLDSRVSVNPRLQRPGMTRARDEVLTGPARPPRLIPSVLTGWKVPHLATFYSGLITWCSVAQ